MKKSYEYGEHAGLGFVKGEVCPLEPDLADRTLKVPQIGWNALHIVRDDPLFRYIHEGEYVYYVHSYYGTNCAESTLAVSDYSIPVTGVVRAGRVYGTQFHPEKSGDTGLRILKAFSELEPLRHDEIVTERLYREKKVIIRRKSTRCNYFQPLIYGTERSSA